MTKKISILVLLLLMVTVSFAGNISRAHFTSNVVNREPIDNISRLESSYTSIYFFSDIQDCVGCKIAHQWWFDDELIHTQRTTSKYKRYRWWSKITPRERIGEWRVNVTVNGKSKYSKMLDYFDPSAEQKKLAPVKQRLQIQGISECEEKLKHFHTLTKENPDDPYYAFMFKKWGTRCYNE